MVGLGHIAQTAVLPAFAHAKSNSRLVALVSGDEQKRKKLGKKYGARTYGYEQLEECLASEDVDAVYIALPNDQHLEFVQRSARTGVHVLCEKPLGLSAEECEQMIRVCDENDVKLMCAYRLHFEPSNLDALKWVTSGKLGAPKFFTSEFSYQVKGDNIRTDASHGGGAIYDIGIYCINAARMLFQAEPEEVFAFAAGGDERFEGIPAGHTVSMRFSEDRLASFTCHFGSSATTTYRVVGEKGDLRLENAYEYLGPREQQVTIKDKKQKRTFKQVDQFAPELLEFSSCVLEDREPEPNGWEGLADVRIIEAVLQSAEEGRPVRLDPFEKPKRPTHDRAHRVPPVREHDLVNAESAQA